MERRKWATPSTMRSKLMLEVCSELVGVQSWKEKWASVSLRVQGDANTGFDLLGSDSPAAIDVVARGDAHIALINPAAPLAVAYRGKGSFRAPIPLRAIAVIPSYDQLAFAVAERTGLTSLAEIKEQHYPLRLSLRDEPQHSVRFFVEHVFAKLGFSLDDVVGWCGEVTYDRGFVFERRLAAVQRGEVDALFDEAVENWVGPALDSGMRVLALDASLLDQLEADGFRRAVLPRNQYPKLPADVPTLDFSGWPMYTLASAPDALIGPFCAALESRKASIPWQGTGPLPLESMCRDSAEGPLDIPLHPAAEAFWRER